ncbi:MAG: glutamine--fructose-6-phosphate transaminase (isomerizing) [Anaerolineales bacterium]
MCGIVGYIGPQDATPIILQGLQRLEYRGYDSAGIAIYQDGQIHIRRDAGKISHLFELVRKNPISGNIGIGHTRWATHGVPNARNAHPHLSSSGNVVIVHNGIVENYLSLYEELQAEGVQFQSETDTEVIVHLIEHHLSHTGSLINAVRNTLNEIRGAHGIVVFSRDEPDKLIAARIGNAGGVVIGLGQDENFVASDLPAILGHTQKVVFLDPQQIAVITQKSLEIQSLDGKPIAWKAHQVAWDPITAEKGEYRHFMQKEIHEQVRSCTDTIAGRVDFSTYKVDLAELKLTPAFAQAIQKIFIIACGTAYHAGLVGKFLIERIARIPVEVDIASEFRYRNPIIGPNTVTIAISQSGETADTLAAMEEARKHGSRLWSIVNAIGSQAMRLADGYISMQCGPEIGVASTKAYTAPLIDLYLLAVQLADLRNMLEPQERQKLVGDLRKIPNLVGACLDREDHIIQVAKEFTNVSNCLYLGRGINMPTAYEGALKLKEISYIHAEAYPAGEMKHGPIALIDKNLPIIAIAPQDPWYEKMLSQIEQAKARGGKIITIATDGDEPVSNVSDRVIWLPPTPWLLSPVTTIIPLQLLAYHIAVMRGLDVDQPRNLAKSVTVE